MGKATGVLTVGYGNGTGTAGYATAPTQATLLSRVKNEYQIPFNAMVAAAGWTRYTPSGATAVDWDTVTYDPSAAGVGSAFTGLTVLGREWFRFDDTYQTACPIYVTFTYRMGRMGTTTNNVYVLYPLVSVSTVVNSDGTPGGLVRSASFYGNGTTTNTGWASSGRVDVPSTFFAAKQDGFLALKCHDLVGSAFTTYAGSFVVERLRDLVGAPQSADRGVLFAWKAGEGSASNVNNMAIVSTDTNTNATRAGGVFPLPTLYTTGANGLEIPVFASVVGTPAMRSSRNIIGGFPGDFPISAEATLPIPGGGAGVFKSFGVAGDTYGSSSGEQGRLLVRWED